MKRLLICLASFVPLFAQDRGMKNSTEDFATEKRVALVIGNGAYKNVTPLKNPPNDARAIAASLKSIGFEVITRIDANKKEMREAISRFGVDIRGGGVGLFYYAGHGVQASGRNYLIPVTASIESEGDVEDEAISVDQILSRMGDARNRLNIVILDACRNNPFARFRSVSRGLTQVVAPSGTFIAYATAPGSVAEDGTGSNGIYTEALLKEIQMPGVQLEDMFKNVLSDVKRQTDNKQVPWSSSSVEGKFYFVPGAEANVPDQNLPDKSRPKQFNISDLDSAARKEEDVRSSWTGFLTEMSKSYASVVEYEKRDVSAELKVAAWKRFLTTYADDDPYSTEDDVMRSKANTQIALWTSRKTTSATKGRGKDEAIERDLIAYYPFEGNPGDASGNQRNGVTFGSCSYTAGIQGQGLQIVGDRTGYHAIGGYVKIPPLDTASLSELSLSVWVKEENSTPGDAYIYFSDDCDIGWCGIGHFSTNYNFSVGGNTKGIVPLVHPFDPVVCGTWTHYALVYSNGYLNGYINARSVGEMKQRLHIAGTNATIGAHRWGGRYAGFSTQFSGIIDELRIYKRALTPDEVQILYEGGR